MPSKAKKKSVRQGTLVVFSIQFLRIFSQKRRVTGIVKNCFILTRSFYEELKRKEEFLLKVSNFFYSLHFFLIMLWLFFMFKS